MLRVFFITLLFVANIHAIYTNNNEDIQVVINYLQHYGYLQEETTDLSTGNGSLVTYAILLFQEYFNLPGNGSLNAETINMIHRPRCGVMDIPTRAFAPISSKWPKTHLTWNFYLAPADVLRLTEYAFRFWADISSLTFERVANNPDILISYQLGVHSYINRRSQGECSVHFDGLGTILAHAMFPSGNMDFLSEIHVDFAETWYTKLSKNPPNTQHLLQTLVHEIGHALGLQHSTHNTSIMFPYAPTNQYPVKLSIEDINSIRNLYGIKPTHLPSTSTSTSTPIPTTKSIPDKNTYPDLCTIRNVSAILILNRQMYIAYRHHIWLVSLDGQTYDRPLLLTDYMKFLPRNFTHVSAVYQRPSGEIVLFVNKWIYMVEYPSLVLKSGWPRRFEDIGLPTNARINAALNTYMGRTFVLYNDHAVAEIDDCRMTVSKYELLHTIFPGVPPQVSLAFRYIDGYLYFVSNGHFFKYNEFENTIASVGKFDLEIINIICPKEGILQQLYNLLNRLTHLRELQVDNTNDDVDD